MENIYETTNHFYSVNVRVHPCSKCGQRTLHLSTEGHAPICDGCAAVESEAAAEQELAYSPRLHQHLQARWFGR